MQAVNKTGLTRLTRLTRLYENSWARFRLLKIRISATTKVLLYRSLESGMFSSNSNSRPSSSDEIVRKKKNRQRLKSNQWANIFFAEGQLQVFLINQNVLRCLL